MPSFRVEMRQRPRPAIRPGPDEVLVERVGAAARGAEAAVRGVEVDDRLAARAQLDVMGRGREVSGTEMGHRDLPRLVERDPKPAAARAVAKLDPPDVRVAAV